MDTGGGQQLATSPSLAPLLDTIFLVTDGMPTIGEIVEVPKLIRAITETNKTRGVVIHVITFDKVSGRRLEPLAKQNGGQCVVRGFED